MPDLGILLSGLVIVVLSIVGTLQFVVSAASFTILLYYAIANIAALRLSPDHKLYPKWVAVLGVASCTLLAFSLRFSAVLTGLVLLAIGFVLRLLLRRRKNGDA